MGMSLNQNGGVVKTVQLSEYRKLS